MCYGGGEGVQVGVAVVGGREDRPGGDVPVRGDSYGRGRCIWSVL